MNAGLQGASRHFQESQLGLENRMMMWFFRLLRRKILAAGKGGWNFA